MFTRSMLMVAFALLATTACNPFRSEQAVQVSAQDKTLNSRWHANLASPASLAGIVQMRGTASMAPSSDGNGTNITLALSNASPGGLHPWTVERGQCGAGMSDGVFGPHEAYEPLSIGSSGLANGAASVPVHTSTGGSYFVVIRASVANPAAIVACGNLAAPTR